MTEQQVQEKPDRKDLKIQALINKITATENQNADYQVELHMKTEELNEAYTQVQQLQQSLADVSRELGEARATSPEIVHGEVLEEASADSTE